MSVHKSLGGDEKKYTMQDAKLKHQSERVTNARVWQHVAAECRAQHVTRTKVPRHVVSARELQREDGTGNTQLGGIRAPDPQLAKHTHATQFAGRDSARNAEQHQKVPGESDHSKCIADDQSFHESLASPRHDGTSISSADGGAEAGSERYGMKQADAYNGKVHGRKQHSENKMGQPGNKARYDDEGGSGMESTTALGISLNYPTSTLVTKYHS